MPGVLCPIVVDSGQGSRDPSEPLVIRPTPRWSGSLVFSLVNCMDEATCGIPISHVKQMHIHNTIQST